MELDYSDIDGARVVTAKGRLDSTTSPDFESSLMALIETGPGHVIIDCAAVDYMSSAGLRVLLMGLKRVKSSGGSMAIAGLAPNIREVFKISGFDKMFKVHDNREAALQDVA